MAAHRADAPRASGSAATADTRSRRGWRPRPGSGGHGDAGSRSARGRSGQSVRISGRPSVRPGRGRRPGTCGHRRCDLGDRLRHDPQQPPRAARRGRAQRRRCRRLRNVGWHSPRAATYRSVASQPSPMFEYTISGLDVTPLARSSSSSTYSGAVQFTPTARTPTPHRRARTHPPLVPHSAAALRRRTRS